MRFGGCVEALPAQMTTNNHDNTLRPTNPNNDTTLCACVWSSRSSLVVSDIWRVVHSCGGLAAVVGFIKKITRVTRFVGDMPRFDFFVEQGTSDEVFTALRIALSTLSRRTCRRIGGQLTIKRHEPYWQRQEERLSRGSAEGAGVQRDLAPTNGNKPFPMCSLNINSGRYKMLELGEYAKANSLGLICVQETRFTVMDADVCMRDYRSFSVPSEKGKLNHGKVGLCTLIHKSTPAALYGKWQSPFNVVTKVWLGETHYVVNVYIPCEGTAHRAQAITDLTRRLGDIESERDISAVVIIMGDWNMRPETVDGYLREWAGLINLMRLAPRGDPRTYHTPNGSWSALDHVVVAQGLRSATALWVDRSCDMSDHWPLRFKLSSSADLMDRVPIPRVVLQTPVVQKISIDSALNDNKIDFCNSNKFRVLAQQWVDEEEEAEVALGDHPLKATYNSFIGTVLEVAKTNKLMKRVWKQRKGPRYLLPQNCRRAVLRRKAAHKAWVTAKTKGLDTASGLWVRYIKVRRAARKAIVTAQSSARAKAVNKTVHQLRSGSKTAKVFWKSLKGLIGKNADESGRLLGPVLDSEGTINFGKDATTVWEDYTKGLLDDATGHSKDREFWSSPERFGNYVASPELTADINKDIDWAELNCVLRTLPRHKAPGPDTIPYELLRLAYVSPNIDNGDLDAPGNNGPQNHFGAALLKLCNSMFKHGIFAEANVTLMTYIYKKHSVMDPSNFRGIALINTIVKLVTILVEKRLRGALEAVDFLIDEQAGFRSREECMAQVVAFYEVICRRCLSSKNTFVAFVDFKKAYDYVPHEAALAKLKLAGVHGRCLQFLASLYSDGSLRLKVDGAPGVTSIDVLRGVRQGCNMSPLAFDVFINDILDTRGADGKSIRDLGVTIVSTGSRQKVCGLLFADDLALTAPTRRKLRKGLLLLGQWAQIHDMAFGIDKCGVMGFGPSGQAKAVRWQDKWSFGDRAGVVGEKIKVVDKYVYLGCLITHDLVGSKGIDLNAMALARANVSLGTLNKIAPILKDVTIPSVIKVNLIKATLVPCLVFGAELWGMNIQRTKHGQNVLVRAAKLIFSDGNQSARSMQVDQCVLLTELGIPSLHAMANAARARAWFKYPSLKTIVSKLMAAPMSGRARSWGSGTKQYLEKYYPAAAAGRRSPLTSKNVAAFVKTKQHARELGKGEPLAAGDNDTPAAQNVPVTLLRYVNGRFGCSTSFIKQAIAYPFLVRGVNILSLFRTGGVQLGRKLSFIGKMSITYRERCPCCGLEVGGETRLHMLVYCAKWDSLRRKFLAAPIHKICCDLFNDRFPNQLSEDEKKILVIVLLGGEVRGGDDDEEDVDYKLKDWVLTFSQGRTGITNTKSLPTVSSMGQLSRSRETGMFFAPGDVVTPQFVAVACFLQEVYLVRKHIVKPLLLSSRAEALRGMAVVAPLRLLLEGAPDERPDPLFPG